MIFLLFADIVEEWVQDPFVQRQIEEVMDIPAGKLSHNLNVAREYLKSNFIPDIDQTFIIEALKETEKFEDPADFEPIQISSVCARLPNLGNTCYMNAALQCLFAFSSFREGIMNISAKEETIIAGLQHIFEEMIRNDVTRQTLTKFKKSLHSPFNQYIPGEARYFSILLLKWVREELKHIDDEEAVSCLENLLSYQSTRTCVHLNSIFTTTELSEFADLGILENTHAYLAQRKKCCFRCGQNFKDVDIECTISTELPSMIINTGQNFKKIIWIRGKRYDLKSFVGGGVGHSIAYCKEGDSQWYRYNDSDRTLIDASALPLTNAKVAFYQSENIFE